MFLSESKYDEFCLLDIQCQRRDKNTKCNRDFNLCECQPRYIAKSYSDKQYWCIGKFKIEEINRYRPDEANWYFDCGFSTVWKFSYIPATLILSEINFARFQRVKNCHLNNLGGFEFSFFGNFTLESVKNIQKFNNQSCSNGQKGNFWSFKMTKIDFT